MRNISVNNGEYVDLGLSVKWCSHNVDGVNPSDYGMHLAWGETVEKGLYMECNYDYNNPFEDVGSKHGFGGRMPTYVEFQELEDKCQSFWGEYYGVKGRYFIGPNGNVIFLPAAGYCEGTSVHNVGSGGCYWSSTPNSSHYAYYFLFFRNLVFPSPHRGRHYGLSVRLVQD